MEQVHRYIEWAARSLETLGVAVILGAIVLAGVHFVREGRVSADWRAAYERCRANIGRGILLGLELLVGADIIATITSPLTFTSLGLLASVMLIRTFLSFSLETEIEGCWPWQRRARPRDDGTPADR